MVSWIRQKFKNKLSLLSPSNIKHTFKQHGIALVVIIIFWEIIEDLVIPSLFAYLGSSVSPVFYVGIPASILICSHWIGIPLLWGMWVKLSSRNKSDVELSCCNKGHK